MGVYEYEISFLVSVKDVHVSSNSSFAGYTEEKEPHPKVVKVKVWADSEDEAAERFAQKLEMLVS